MPNTRFLATRIKYFSFLSVIVDLHSRMIQIPLGNCHLTVKTRVMRSLRVFILFEIKVKTA